MTALTRQEIVQHLRVSSDPVISQAADLIEHDGRALAATSQSEYERALEARLQGITDERDRLAMLLGEARDGLGRAADSLITYGSLNAAADAHNLIRRLRSLDANPQEKPR